MIIATVLAGWFRIEKRISNSDDKAEKGRNSVKDRLSSLETEIRQQMHAIERDVSQLRAHVAENYMDKQAGHSNNQQVLKAMADLRRELKADMATLQNFLSQLIGKKPP